MHGCCCCSGTDRRYYVLDYPPSDDYLMVANTDLQTDGYRLPSNQAVWSPKLAAPLDQVRSGEAGRQAGRSRAARAGLSRSHAVSREWRSCDTC